jgi:hypothetical protein
MTQSRILLLADTPNLYRSAIQKYGPSAWPDYAAFRRAASTGGSVHCEAIVNGGVSASFVSWLQQIGYVITYSHAEDVDEMLIGRAVALHRTTDSIVIASGDGKNIELINLFKAVNKRTLVAGITGTIHHGLTAVADAVIEFPVRRFGTRTRCLQPTA